MILQRQYCWNKIKDLFRIKLTQEQETVLISNFNKSDYYLRFFVMGWLLFQMFTYLLMSERPIELYWQMNWFDKVFMPFFPPLFIWLFIWSLVMVSNIFLIFDGQKKWCKWILFFGIAYINTIRWKYGFLSHVGHVLVLYHVFSVFISRVLPSSDDKKAEYALSIRWVYAGILFTYTMSGFWKIGGTIFKLLFKPHDMTWFNPISMKVNSIVGYRDWDMDLEILKTIYTFNGVFYFAFLVMLCVQITSVFGAVFMRILPFIALANIIFHLVNPLLIHVEFFATPMVLIILFFPYHLLNNSKFDVLKVYR